MDETQVYTRITQIVRDVLDDDAVVLTAATRAKDVPNWDSFNHISIMVSVESAFGVRFTTTELSAIENVGGIVAAIQRKLAK